MARTIQQALDGMIGVYLPIGDPIEVASPVPKRICQQVTPKQMKMISKPHEEVKSKKGLNFGLGASLMVDNDEEGN